MNVKILYEDAHIIVVVKPAGMPSQAERSTSMDMVSYLKNMLVRRDKIKNPYIAVVHRLDRPVGGVMVYAKTPKAAASLSKQVSERSISKEYMAVLCGDLPQEKGTLTDWLLKDGRTNMSQVVAENSHKDAKKAVLNYQVLDEKEVEGKIYSLVHIHLETGRHHQIRVQMAHAGAPVAGDMKYGSCTERRFRNTALFSSALEFVHPATGKQMRFESKPETDAFGIFS